MAYQALYRSYRPTSFEEVAGQKHIVKTLKNALMLGKTTHAYLFSGPRGIGKTSIARILAKALNCDNLESGEPCNACRNCQLIINNQTSDIIEIDAASNNGVEQMRELLDKVNFLPATLKYKVYIIDEVHMLSISAFNALLKTLEEPPSHVVFILATTEPHKIPLTILSRCQRFDFKPLNNNEIKLILKNIANKEKIKIDEEAISAIAEVAEGGMRDAISILDQVNAYSEENIVLNDVNDVTGRVSNEKLIELVRSFVDGNEIKALTLVDQLLDAGKEVNRLVIDLIQFCRDALIYKNSGKVDEVKSIYQQEGFISLVQSVKKEQLFYYVDILNDVQNKIKFVSSKKVYLEIGIMKIARTTSKDFDIKTRIEALETKIHDGIGGQTSTNNAETEEKLGLIEYKINKITTELSKLKINEFKEEVYGKIAFLENLASKNASNAENSSTDYSELEDVILDKVNAETANLTNKLGQIEESVAKNVLSAATLSAFETRINEIETRFNTTDNRIAIIENMPKSDTSSVAPIIDNEKYEAKFAEVMQRLANVDEAILALKSNNQNETPSLFDSNIETANDVAARIQKLENFCQSCEAMFAQIQMQVKQVKEIQQSLQAVPNTPVANVQLEGKINEIDNQITDIREYSLKIGARLQEVQDALLKQSVVTSDVTASSSVKEEKEEEKIVEQTAETIPEVETVAEPAVEQVQPKSVIYDTSKTVVIRQPRQVPEHFKTEEQTAPSVDDVTAKVYDVKRLQKILHQSRDVKSREIKPAIFKTWTKLDVNIGYQLAPIAKLLMEGSFVANGFDELLITYNEAAKCNYLMSEKIHFEACQILKSAFNQDYDFLALPNNIWQEKRAEYTGQYNMGVKYPELKPLNYPELKIVNVNKDDLIASKSASISKAEEIFGRNLIRKEE